MLVALKMLSLVVTLPNFSFSFSFLDIHFISYISLIYFNIF